MNYPFENLEPESFQQFCQALLTKEFPNVQCFSVAQPDGGRDALSIISEDDERSFIMYQVKFLREPLTQPSLSGNILLQNISTLQLRHHHQETKSLEQNPTDLMQLRAIFTG
jgi:hypothetical protein